MLVKRKGETDSVWDSLFSGISRRETHSWLPEFSVWSLMCVSHGAQRIL